MTRFTSTAITAVLAASGLAACAATPDYPVKAGYVAPAPVAPQFPSRQQVATAAPPLASPDASPAPQAESPAPAVETQPLAPAAASPSNLAAPSGPAPTPAPETNAATSPPPASSPAATPPEPTRPAALVRYTAQGKVEAAKGMYRDYVVVKGDHLDLIAHDLKTTHAELAQANHLKAPFELSPGQHLRIPIEKVYVVQTGDTLSAIARRFGVETNDLADLNDLGVHAHLKSGFLIALPSDFHDHGPVRVVPEPVYRYTPGEAPPSSPGGSSSPSFTPPRIEESSQIANQAEVIASAQGRFIWPVRGDVISGFGVTGIGRRNDGVDIRAAQGTPVHAAAAGNVVYAGNQVPGFGNLVLVKHSDGWVTAYAHLDKITVQMRQMVAQGDELGLIGITGGVSEPELHFEVRYAPSPSEKAKPLDPLLVLPK